MIEGIHQFIIFLTNKNIIINGFAQYLGKSNTSKTCYVTNLINVFPKN